MESQPNPRPADRNWIVGGVLIFLGALFLLGQFVHIDLGPIIPLVILGGIGFTFLMVYFNDRSHWWALIPAYVMFAVDGIILLSWLNVPFIASYVMFAIALPFLYVYFRNRTHWWALIPAGIMGSIGVALLIGSSAHYLMTVIPVLLIIGGIYLLVRNTGGQKSESVPLFKEPVVPMTGPEADKPR